MKKKLFFRFIETNLVFFDLRHFILYCSKFLQKVIILLLYKLILTKRLRSSDYIKKKLPLCRCSVKLLIYFNKQKKSYLILFFYKYPLKYLTSNSKLSSPISTLIILIPFERKFFAISGNLLISSFG